MNSSVGENEPSDDRSKPVGPVKVKATPSVILKREQGTLDPPQAPNEIGRLREYRVNKILGEGGMGVVYLAWDSSLHRSVALKVMKRSIAENDQSRQRFILEARATAAIDHDHIVTIFQVGDHNGVPYLVMKHLEGQTLEERLRKDRILPPKEAARIARQVAEGLQAAHACNLIHRDIKPSNIWLEKARDRVKILDFGLARIADSTDPNITQTGVILGTPAYMSPEQAAGMELDCRSDLFSLGTVLYRLVVGKSPFRGSNNLAILRSLSIDEPTPPRELNPQVPERLSKLIMKLLEKDADLRPSTAASVALMLETIEEDLVQPESAEFVISRPGGSPLDMTPISTVSSPSLKAYDVPPYQVPMMASALAEASLDQIALEPVDDDPPAAKDVKSGNPKQPATAGLAASNGAASPTVSAKPKGKAEVSPLLRKLALQAAMQDEIEEEPSYIMDSRSAVIDEWRRRQYWENFPWRPVLFVFGLIVSLIVLSMTLYTFWPMIMEQFGT
jgi:serine/threonine protein kinase